MRRSKNRGRKLPQPLDGALGHGVPMGLGTSHRGVNMNKQTDNRQWSISILGDIELANSLYDGQIVDITMSVASITCTGATEVNRQRRRRPTTARRARRHISDRRYYLAIIAQSRRQYLACGMSTVTMAFGAYLAQKDRRSDIRKRSIEQTFHRVRTTRFAVTLTAY